MRPYKKMVAIYASKKNKKYKFIDILEEVYVQRFFKESDLIKDYDACIEKVRECSRYCLIQSGNWNYKVINFCFIREMLSNIIWCIENGYKPLIDIMPSGGTYSTHSNLWEKMYVQPFGECLKKVKESGNYIVCPIKTHCIMPRMVDARDGNKVEFWNKLFNTFVKYNEACQKYMENEYIGILKYKKCLACLIRGTDYTKLKPAGHPIQPSISELMDKAEQIMKKEGLEYIYLATEEKKYADAFKERFGDIVLENKRNYFDVLYETGSLTMVSQVSFDREDDDFLKILEYMSSINLLAKCNSLVAGLCGGSEAAVYFNGNKYTTTYLFDKGIY